jgi:hypothetical protein
MEMGGTTDFEVVEIVEMAGVNREEATGVPCDKHIVTLSNMAYILVAREDDKLAGWVQKWIKVLMGSQ